MRAACSEAYHLREQYEAGFSFFMPDSGIKKTNAAAYAACSEAYRLCEQYEAGI